MRKRIAVKNHFQEIQLTANRSIIAMIVIAILVALLVLRLAWLQIYKNDVYTTLSTNNWMDLVPLEPTRGLIYDRNGVLLAENIPVFSLEVTPYEVKHLDNVLADLGKVIALSDNDLLQFRKQLKQHRRFDQIPLKVRLSEEEVMRFTENQHRFPGVVIAARLMRNYPFGETFSHVLGYVGRINTQELNEIDATNYSASHYIGKLGIEKYYENQLHGKVGYKQEENDASGKSIRVLKEIKGTPGQNLYLTLDSGLQFTAENALKGHRGAVVALNPENGDVLALVSEPGYDPNQFVVGINQQDYQALQTSLDRPLYNRALLGMYPPASTVKPIIALQGLETGMIDESSKIYDPGWFEITPGGHRYHDWKFGGHGMVNVNMAIMSSCDIFFYRLAQRMGIDKVDAILTQFGYGQPTQLDIDHESAGVVASPAWKQKMKHTPWYPGDTVISGIGQGYMQVTPMQLASAVATIANRGKRIKPHLLLGDQIPGSAYKLYQPVVLGQVAVKDPQNWERVIAGMENVVLSGGSAFALFGTHYTYTVAAKTGSAQVVAKHNKDGTKDNQASWPERLRDHHMFIAFAPVDHPRIALAIVTENSNDAVKTARTLLDYYLGNQQNADRTTQTQIQKTPA